MSVREIYSGIRGVRLIALAEHMGELEYRNDELVVEDKSRCHGVSWFLGVVINLGCFSVSVDLFSGSVF